MYDILFIDDKFEEIKETYSDFQNQHVRCFYSDGENFLPTRGDAKEKLPFKNLKYISLDLHLENLGIITIKNNKTALSTLASIIESFIDDGKDITIIANTSFPDEFDENTFFRYLDFKNNPTIKKEAKDKDKTSLLHENAVEITKQAHQEILRNVIIREAIEVENLIYEKIQKNFASIASKLNNKSLKDIENSTFQKKIQSYKLAFGGNLDKKLNDVRKLRNKFAHGSPPTKNLLDFLEEVTGLKGKI
ncbi:hypothetical protein MS2017_0025 [Bathymodiolus thermophilus thioautotrophic gill symbiont]|uniref:Uncharacterized protein n=1 Tax=Bathymodiolus thermophilus thioautotrophic gill symbiont TaxID=2360 RepID=A0A3G3IIZ3_9GAMM|nr:hypothetical protein [Bathymodiolus thermophilus thioautotrophic gill symbiont]AYQ55795.1 hypothetical protein MS2017_0025 [Bathymodiolus thermophilus thioautotrophic gill symbiont]